MKPKNQPEEQPAPEAQDAARQRREFLAKVLRTGAYVAPIVAAMSLRNLASAQGSGPGSTH